MQQIILFGATGGTGRLVVQQGLQEGNHVTVIVRNPDSFTIRNDRLEIIKGDVFQPHTFEKALAGKDAVISCLGIQKREPTTVYSEGMSNIIKAMKVHSVKRIICLSAGAVIVPPRGSFMIKFFIKNILQKIFAHLYSDMLTMEKILEITDLNYSIVRPSWLRDTKYTRNYRTAINEHLRNPTKISRADLAHFIVTHLTDEKTFKARIEISY
jgi:putative NADH-flavin reductase